MLSSTAKCSEILCERLLKPPAATLCFVGGRSTLSLVSFRPHRDKVEQLWDGTLHIYLLLSDYSHTCMLKTVAQTPYHEHQEPGARDNCCSPIIQAELQELQLAILACLCSCGNRIPGITASQKQCLR